MKKFLAAVFLLCAGVIFTAVWFSPLTALGGVKEYYDNVAIADADGICYGGDGVYRVDLCGGLDDMLAALDDIGAKEVKRVEYGNKYIVYAYSARVCSAVQTTADGEKYNVMAACENGAISIGTPILSGCY